MGTEATATQTLWGELHALATMGADYEKAMESDVARLAEMVDAAVEHTRKLEQELEEIRRYLEAITP